MSHVQAINDKISSAKNDLADAEKRFNEAEEEYTNAKNDKDYLTDVIHDLYIQLQAAEEVACYTAAQEARPVGTKYKWTHKTIPETYCVAVQTKQGVLQVKSVTNGVVQVHDTDCNCGPCWEFNHKAPWRGRKPLKTDLFTDLDEWKATLPMNQGNLVITSAPISDKALRELCMAPLVNTTDALKLKELEGRFPGGVFVLSSSTKQYEISYKRTADAYDHIYWKELNLSFFHFKDFSYDKYQLMVEWHGLYIDLSHLL